MSLLFYRRGKPQVHSWYGVLVLTLVSATATGDLQLTLGDEAVARARALVPDISDSAAYDLARQNFCNIERGEAVVGPSIDDYAAARREYLKACELPSEQAPRRSYDFALGCLGAARGVMSIFDDRPWDAEARRQVGVLAESAAAIFLALEGPNGKGFQQAVGMALQARCGRWVINAHRQFLEDDQVCIASFLLNSPVREGVSNDRHVAIDTSIDEKAFAAARSRFSPGPTDFKVWEDCALRYSAAGQRTHAEQCLKIAKQIAFSQHPTPDLERLEFSQRQFILVSTYGAKDSKVLELAKAFDSEIEFLLQSPDDSSKWLQKKLVLLRGLSKLGLWSLASQIIAIGLARSPDRLDSLRATDERLWMEYQFARVVVRVHNERNTSAGFARIKDSVEDYLRQVRPGGYERSPLYLAGRVLLHRFELTMTGRSNLYELERTQRDVDGLPHDSVRWRLTLELGLLRGVVEFSRRAPNNSVIRFQEALALYDDHNLAIDRTKLCLLYGYAMSLWKSGNGSQQKMATVAAEILDELITLLPLTPFVSKRFAQIVLENRLRMEAAISGCNSDASAKMWAKLQSATAPKLSPAELESLTEILPLSEPSYPF